MEREHQKNYELTHGYKYIHKYRYEYPEDNSCNAAKRVELFMRRKYKHIQKYKV